MKNAAAGQLLIFVLFVIGSIISSIIQSRKNAQEERDSGAPGKKPRRIAGGEPPVPHWPAPAAPHPWEQELKRLLDGKTSPPRIPPQNRPATARTAPPKVPAPILAGRREMSESAVAVSSPLSESTTAYARASQLDAKVQARLKQIEKSTETAKPDPFARPAGHGSIAARNWMAHSQNIREAFVASLIFGKPHALSPSEHFDPL